MIQFDKYFSNRLVQPPTSWFLLVLCGWSQDVSKGFNRFPVFWVQDFLGLSFRSSSALWELDCGMGWDSKNTFEKRGVKQNLQLARLTWNLRIRPWKRKIMFQTIILRFYVNLLGCWLFDHFLAKIFEVRYFLVFFWAEVSQTSKKAILGLGKACFTLFL